MKMTNFFTVGLYIFVIFRSHVSLASTLVPAPDTVEQYMATSDVVLIGRMGNAVKAHKFYGYQASAAELKRIDAGTHLSVGIPVVDYEIEIQEVISDENSILKNLDTPVLRLFRDHNHKELLEQVEDSGTFLLFLTLNPDNQTFGLYSLGHKVNIDGETPVFNVAGEVFEALRGEINSIELITAVRNYN